MFHHLLHLPFVIFHFFIAVLLVATAVIVLRPLAMVARHRCGSSKGRASTQHPSENAAFEDYRQATIKRLEQEGEEFRAYLARLRRAADAAAFEAFLSARRTGGQSAS